MHTDGADIPANFFAPTVKQLSVSFFSATLAGKPLNRNMAREHYFFIAESDLARNLLYRIW
jgi:hypothetical protein